MTLGENLRGWCLGGCCLVWWRFLNGHRFRERLECFSYNFGPSRQEQAPQANSH